MYVGTSTSEEVAIEFAEMQDPGSYVYKIDPSGLEGIDVNATRGSNALEREMEIAVRGGVPESNIISAQRVFPDETLGPTIPNPLFKAGG